MKDLEIRIQKIEERNKLVEDNKAWETSKTRITLILLLTYFFATLYLIIADTTNPFLGALVPCGGFLLSTQSLKNIKQHWIKKYRREKRCYETKTF